MTVREMMDGYYQALEAEGATAYKIRSQTKPVLRLLGSFQVSDVRGPVLDSYRNQRSREKSHRNAPVAQSTINREMTYLRAAMRRAHEEEAIDRVPRFRMRPETGERRDWWTVEQVDAVLEHLRLRHPCLADLVEFYYLTGWRKKEALRLEWSAVDFQREVVRLVAKNTKEKDHRVIPIVGAIREILERRAKDRRQDCPFVFHRDGVERKDFARAWENARKAAGCPQNLLHGLRRTMARRYLLAGYPVELIMKIGGWKSREMVELYAKLETEDLKKAMLDVEKRTRESM